MLRPKKWPPESVVWQVLTTYWPEDEKDKPVIIDGRVLHDDESAVVTRTSMASNYLSIES